MNWARAEDRFRPERYHLNLNALLDDESGPVLGFDKYLEQILAYNSKAMQLNSFQYINEYRDRIPPMSAHIAISKLRNETIMMRAG